ncbi:MAG: deoxyhypusine synthase [Thermoplasmata archaeon]|nr:deoxyhypusine synthase [Thermoplasmata archaeon]
MEKIPTVKDIKLCKGMNIDNLVREMKKSGGFVAKKVAVAADIVEKMLRDKNCFTFLSFPACIIATGVRGVIVEMIKNKWVDAIVTTCGTLDHDLARVWRDYLHGSFLMDDVELHKKDIHRLGNVLVPMESYGRILEEKMQPILADLYEVKKEWSTKDIIWEFGKRLENEEKGKESILYWAWKNNIPIFVPGITDGAFGSQLWLFYQEHRDFKIDLLKDEQDLSDIVFNAKKSGAIIIGGGISKHHVIWWNQFKEGLDYAVYLTTAVEYDGSLSGAQTREAISWGKIKEMADHVTVEGDATVTLPIIIGAIVERLKI